MEEGLIKRLMSSIKCSSCGQHYHSYEIDVLGHNEDIWFLKVRCDACNTQSLMAAVIKETHALSASDFTGSNPTKTPQSEPVHASDIMEMHDFLAIFDGDFQGLFEKG